MTLPLKSVVTSALRRPSRLTRVVVVAFAISVEMVSSVVYARKIYWTDFGTDKIKRSNLDGSAVEDLVTFSIPGLTGPKGIAIDLAASKMYWTFEVFPAHKIQRANLDGSNLEVMVTTFPPAPLGIALDPASNKMYWTDPAFD